MGVCWGAEGGGGGVTTHTRVSGEMVKPSMYNCLTLIKGGCRGEGWISRGHESCLKPGGRGGGVLEDLDPSRLLRCRFVSYTWSGPDFVH